MSGGGGGRAGGGVGGARERILARVAAAVAGRERTGHPGGLETLAASGAARRDPAAAFVKRFTSSGGEVLELGGGDAGGGPAPGDWLTAWLRAQDPEVRDVAVGPEVPAGLRPRLPEADPERACAGVSAAWAAVAETGSLVLLSTGTRAVQLLPPLHAVWVPPGRIFARLEDALRELEPGLPAAVGLHSGPSKSADIGRTVVTGVHGPGRCVAVLGGEFGGG